LLTIIYNHGGILEDDGLDTMHVVVGQLPLTVTVDGLYHQVSFDHFTMSAVMTHALTFLFAIYSRNQV
jgi:hypothetical protein